MAKAQFDVGIVGSGPAGMFAALTLARLTKNSGKRPRIAIFEKGKIRSAADAEDTKRRHDDGEKVDVTSGWGGAGSFSDGKYNLDKAGKVGARLVDEGYMSMEDWNRHLFDAAAMFIEFGGDSDRFFGLSRPEDEERVKQIQRIGMSQRMLLHRFPILHLGTSNAHRIVENIRAELTRLGVEIITECYVEDLNNTGKLWELNTTKGQYRATRVILCPGRSGANWFQKVAEGMGIQLVNNGVDIGVRVETSDLVMSELIRLFYESKFYFRNINDDYLRTFCMCPSGHVAIESYRDTGIFCANGHTDPEIPSPNCNFSILQTQWFTRPFNDPHRYGERLADLATLLSGGVLVQRLGDLRRVQRSNPQRMLDGLVKATLSEAAGAVPGDIGLAMPYRFVHGILAFLEALSHVAPGINADDTILYFPEIKWNAVKAVADALRGFQAAERCHVAGDGTGYTRGINGAAIMGMSVAMWIASEVFGEDISNYRSRVVEPTALETLKYAA